MDLRWLGISSETNVYVQMAHHPVIAYSYPVTVMAFLIRSMEKK